MLSTLFWLGVALAPAAGLLLFLGEGLGPLRVAAATAIVSVVLIGLSVTLRKDPAQVEEDLSEEFGYEIGLVRDEVNRLRHGIEVSVRREVTSLRTEVRDEVESARREVLRIGAMRVPPLGISSGSEVAGEGERSSAYGSDAGAWRSADATPDIAVSESTASSYSDPVTGEVVAERLLAATADAAGGGRHSAGRAADAVPETTSHGSAAVRAEWWSPGNGEPVSGSTFSEMSKQRVLPPAVAAYVQPTASPDARRSSVTPGYPSSVSATGGYGGRRDGQGYDSGRDDGRHDVGGHVGRVSDDNGYSNTSYGNTSYGNTSYGNSGYGNSGYGSAGNTGYGGSRHGADENDGDGRAFSWYGGDGRHGRASHGETSGNYAGSAGQQWVRPW